MSDPSSSPTPLPPRLLLIEENADTAYQVRKALRDYFRGDCVRHCTSVAQALQTELRQVDLVLSAMDLPDGTGLDALTKLLQRRADLPFVLLTGEVAIDNAIAAIRRGAYDFVVMSGDYLFAVPLIVEKNLAIWRTKQDNLLLQEQLSQTLEEVRVKNRQLEEAVRMLEAMAATDPLTGLANRRAFNTALERGFAEASRYGQDLACLMIDVDGFKQYNDTFGHPRGDDLLRVIARVLEANCRRSDVAGRFGGDEFILLLPQTDLPTARLVAGRIAEQFLRSLDYPSGGPETAARTTLSMGLACLRHSEPASPEQIIAHADHALYAAKQTGKGRLVVYSPSPIATGAAPTRPATAGPVAVKH